MSENGRSRRNGGFDEDSAQIQKHQNQDEDTQLEKIWKELENSEEGIEIDPEKFLRDMAILDDLIPLPDFDLSASWQDFKEKYPDLLGDQEAADQQSSAFASEEERPKRKRSRRPIRAAIVVVMILAMLSMASCGIIEYIIKAAGDWSEDTFGYRLFQELRAENPKPELPETQYYNSLDEALNDFGISHGNVPTWIPEGYVFRDVDVLYYSNVVKLVATYEHNEEELILTISCYEDSTALELQAAEKLPLDAKIYEHNGIEFYILENSDSTTITWISGTEMYRIFGPISATQCDQMIDSVYER